MNWVLAIDIVSILAVLAALSALWLARGSAFHVDVRWLILVLLAIVFFHDLGNILEWSGMTDALDRVEDYFELLLPVMWFLIAYTLIKEQVEKELRASEEMLDLVINNIPQLVFWKDIDSVFLGCNKVLAKSMGLNDPADIVGKTDYDLCAAKEDADLYREVDRRIMNSDTPELHVTEQLHTAGGSYQWLDTNKTPLHDSDGKVVGILATFEDITEEKRLEEQLRQSQKMEAVGQLAGGVAHDFNNMLQAINGYAEIALGDLDPSHPAHDSIEEIAAAGNRAKTLVSQLLSFSRRQIINPADIDLNEVITDLMKMVRRVIGEHIECNFIPGNELWSVHADRGQMEQVLMNLCVNSRDAMTKGGTITIETGNVLIDDEFISAHQWARPGRFVMLCISDTGCGMDEETLSGVFDPFFTTKAVGKGTGLGLSTVYGIIKQHDGDIHVNSEVSKGTIFHIYLPSVEHRPTEISRSGKGPAVGGTETILVAEDDETVRKLTVKTLERVGYTVLDARNGEEALKLFEAHTNEIALAVLDVVMPGLGGREVHDRMKEVHPGVRVLFSSGYSHNAIHTSFVLDEGLQLIQKPYGPDDLVRRVREVLDA